MLVTDIQEVVVLSDDEEDASELQLVTVKTEQSDSDNLSVIDQTSKPDLIDLTDEAFEDADVPRHYISWLTDLIKRAKLRPTTMDQRLEGASVSTDVIVIDDPEENSEAINKTTDESQTTKVNNHFQKMASPIHHHIALALLWIRAHLTNHYISSRHSLTFSQFSPSRVAFLSQKQYAVLM